MIKEFIKHVTYAVSSLSSIIGVGLNITLLLCVWMAFVYISFWILLELAK